MKEVVIQTDEDTMNGMVRLCTSLLNGPLKNPKLSVSIEHRRTIEKFLTDYQISLINNQLNRLANLNGG